MAQRPLSSARRAAHDALLHLEAQSAHFEVVMRTEPAMTALDPRDAGLAWELVAGVTRRRLTLDAVLESYSDHPLSRLDRRARAALRLGAYQLLFLERVPAHAAVDESVLLVSPLGRRTSGFVNAVLRRIAAGGAARLAGLTEGEGTGSLALRYSCPEWLVARWIAEWGSVRTHDLLASSVRVPERCLRVNRLIGEPADARGRLLQEGIETSGFDDKTLWGHVVPDALLYAGGSLERTASYRDGLVSPQSRAAQLVGIVAAAAAPEAAHVADLCAAPGGKTSHLAAQLPGSRILAVEADESRAGVLRETLARLHAAAVEVDVADARALPAELDAGFDLVLLDAPCSGLGTLAERPDLRWRRRPDDIPRLAAMQRALAARAARLLRPGGALVYAVCTLTPEETLDVVKPLAVEAGLVFDDLGAGYPTLRHPQSGATLLVAPDRDGTSGFFIARLRRPTAQ
jgi:16S rRNA (cytosine967-C5)-methyltransferase